MKILVTGCAGFIGSRVTPKLLKEGHQVLGIDNLSVGLPAPEEHSLLQFEKLDICEKEKLLALSKEFTPDIVLHLAAVHHIPTCESHPELAYRVNIIGTQAVLDAAVDCKQFILISSGAVYDWIEGCLDPQTTPLKPCDVYSISKATNEHQLRVWQQKTQKAAIVARLFNTIGAKDPNAHLIPDILKQLSPERPEGVLHLGNIDRRRDMIYVDDVAAAFAAMSQKTLDQGFHTFNVGTGKEYSVRQIVEHILGILQLNYQIEIDPSRLRAVDRPSQIADIQSTIEAFDWKPEVSFPQAIQKLLEEEGALRRYG